MVLFSRSIYTSFHYTILEFIRYILLCTPPTWFNRFVVHVASHGLPQTMVYQEFASLLVT